MQDARCIIRHGLFQGWTLRPAVRRGWSPPGPVKHPCGPAKIKCAVTGKNKGHTLESFQFRNPSWNKMTTLNIDYDYINDHDYEC